MIDSYAVGANILEKIDVLIIVSYLNLSCNSGRGVLAKFSGCSFRKVRQNVTKLNTVRIKLQKKLR